MGWRDAIGAVLDAAEAAPARQARRTTPATKKAEAPACDVRANAAPASPRRPRPSARLRNLPRALLSSTTLIGAASKPSVKPLRQSSTRSESQSHGADGGVDIWLYSPHSDKPVIVQCKQWRKRVVGVKELREFYSVLKSHDLAYGTFATSSTCSVINVTETG